MRHAVARGWRAVTLNFRSCSGELNRRLPFYHSGHTDDLDEVVGLLAGRERNLRLGIVGVSLGGNVLLKWLGERGSGAPAEVVGAVAISVPFDLASCARVLDEAPRRWVYGANFLRTMRAKVMDKAARDPELGRMLDLSRVRRTRTFAGYDHLVTAPLNGFADEHDYWRRSSSGPYLSRIRRPTLLVNALDDPIVPRDALPRVADLPPSVHAEFLPRGGHAGFIEGGWPWRVRSWVERRAIEFLAPLAAEESPTRRVC